MRQLLLALQFLTILPVKVSGSVASKEVAGSSAFFPAAGAIQGLMAVIMVLISENALPDEISAGLCLLTLIVINGGFHLDGLADTFDALALKSSGDPAADRQRRLLIMKDSRTGAMGATAIMMAILLKFLFLSHIISSSLPAALFGLLFLMPVFSKWGMVLTMYFGIAARKDGLGRIFIDEFRPASFVIASALVIFLSIAAGLLFFSDDNMESLLMLFLLQFTACVMFCFLASKFCEEIFGGLTGDNLGAIGEISEILFLMVISLWLPHSI